MAEDQTSKPVEEPYAGMEAEKPVEEPVTADTEAPEGVPPQPEPVPPAPPKPKRGTWVKPLVRGLLLLVALFLLGALLTYLQFTRPLERQLSSLRVEATQTAEKLQTAEAAQKNDQLDLQAAEERAEQASEQLEVEQTRVIILRSMNELSRARMAVLAEDQAAVTEALNASETYIQEVLPFVGERDPEQASTLEALYTLARNDLERDLSLVSQDLDRIQTELERVETNVLAPSE